MGEKKNEKYNYTTQSLDEETKEQLEEAANLAEEVEWVKLSNYTSRRLLEEFAVPRILATLRAHATDDTERHIRNRFESSSTAGDDDD